MITDWKGNEIKPGMEVAFLQTVIHHPKFIMYVPSKRKKNEAPIFKDVVINEAYDERCWVLSDWMLVEGSDRLYVISNVKSNDGHTYNFIVHLDGKDFGVVNPPVLVIKGVSDIKPDKI